MKLWKVSGGGLFNMLSTSSVQARGSVPVSMLAYAPPFMLAAATVVDPRDEVNEEGVGEGEARRDIKTVRLSVMTGLIIASSSRSESGPSYSD